MEPKSLRLERNSTLSHRQQPWASSQSFCFQSKQDHTLILSHQKCHWLSVMLNFDFLFFFPFLSPSFFALLLHPNCDGWRLSGAGGSWAVAKTHAHQRNIMKVCHLSCMAWSLLLPSWQCTCAVIRLCRADNNYNFTRKTEGSIALRWSNFASYCHALKYLILLHEYRLSCPVRCLYLSLHPFQISTSCLVKMETLKNVLKD